MTIEVTIKHNNPGYDKDIEVFVFDFGAENLLKSNADPSKPWPSTIIKAGEQGTFWVHSTQSLTVREYS